MTHISTVFSYLDINFNYQTVNCILFLINCFNFFFGLYLIMENYEDLNKEGSLQDCDNIFLFSGLSVLNSFTIMIGFSKLYVFSLVGFLFSMGLVIANSLNMNNYINSNCSDYYKDNYNTFWYFYYISFGILCSNLYIYLIKHLIFSNVKNMVKQLNNINDDDNEEQILINDNFENHRNNDNIYEDTD